jgi:hypothetical protein
MMLTAFVALIYFVTASVAKATQFGVNFGIVSRGAVTTMHAIYCAIGTIPFAADIITFVLVNFSTAITTFVNRRSRFMTTVYAILSVMLVTALNANRGMPDMDFLSIVSVQKRNCARLKVSIISIVCAVAFDKGIDVFGASRHFPGVRHTKGFGNNLLRDIPIRLVYLLIAIIALRIESALD